MTVLHELEADVVALQEADRLFGSRPTVLPRQLLAEHHWQVVPLSRRPSSIGWHGNAILVRRGIDIVDSHPVELPRIEPRGAVRADLSLDGHQFHVFGMHLDLSGLRRRHQLRAVHAHLEECAGNYPAVMMGDLNEWALKGGWHGELPKGWQAHAPGRSFPSRQPIAHLDRVLLSPEWNFSEAAAHHSALAATASDHLPVWLDAQLPKK